MNTLGTRIRELRMKKGLTQTDLARGICTPGMISQVESDKSRASYHILFALAARLEVSLDQLFDDVALNMKSTSMATMAKAMVEAGEYRLALPILEELLHTKNTALSNDDLTYRLATCHANTSRVDEAVNGFASLIESSLVRDDNHMLILALLGLGDAMSRKKGYQLAVHHTEQALSTYEKWNENNPDLHGKILFQLAKRYEEIGQVNQALHSYERASLLHESMTSKEQAAKIHLTLAESYHIRGDFEKSQTYASQALVQFMELGNIEAYQDAHIQLLLLSYNETNWQSTVKQLIAIAVEYEEQDSKRERAGKLFATISSICVQFKDLEQAAMTAEDALSLLPQIHPASGVALRTLALVCFYKNEFEKGQAYIGSAITIFRELGMMAELEGATQILIQYLNELGNHREALGHLEKYHHFLSTKLMERGIVL